jgi:hypothetical protein
VKADLFHADGRTTGQTDMVVLIVAFSYFTYAPKKHSGLIKLTRQRWGKHVPPFRRVNVALIHHPPTPEAKTATLKICNFCTTAGIKITRGSALFLPPYMSVYLVILSINANCIETTASWARFPRYKPSKRWRQGSNPFRDMKLIFPVSCFVVSCALQALTLWHRSFTFKF